MAALAVGQSLPPPTIAEQGTVGGGPSGNSRYGGQWATAVMTAGEGTNEPAGYNKGVVK